MIVKKSEQPIPLIHTSQPNRIPVAILAMIFSAASWGFGTVMSKAALETLPPVSLLCIQLFASTSALWGITLVARIRFTKGDLTHGWTGLFEPGIAYLISLIGYQFTTASNAALISALEPFIILVLAVSFLKEHVTRLTVFLMGMSIIGVMMVTGRSQGGDTALLGDGLVLIGTASAAIYVVLSRHSVASLHPLPLAAAQQTVGLGVGLAALPIALVLGELEGLGGISIGIIAFAALSGLIQYSLAFALYLTALKFIPATQAALYLTLIPVFGVTGGVVFLSESLAAIQLLGAGLIITALAIFNWRTASQA